MSRYLFIFLAVLGCCGCLEKNPQVFKESRQAMGTVVTMMAYCDSGEQAQKAFSAAFSEVERLEAQFSPYRETSVMAAVNRHAADVAVPVSEEFATVLRAAVEVGDWSQGAFDVSFAVMSKIWKFPGKVPAPEEVKALLPYVDYKKIKISAETVSLPEGMSLGLGGLVKGYAADRAVEAMVAAGVKNCMANLGGDIKSSGQKGKVPWGIGVQDPRGAGYFATMLLKNGEAVVSSGDYERFFIEDGRRYHHIIDPRTGYPSRELRHVTVVGPRAMVADALATAIMVLGKEGGEALLKKTTGYEGLFIDQQNNLHISKGLKEKVRVLRLPTP